MSPGAEGWVAPVGYRRRIDTLPGSRFVLACGLGAMVLLPGPMPQPDAKVLATAKARADFKVP